MVTIAQQVAPKIDQLTPKRTQDWQTTEIGPLPNDWEAVPLGKLLKFKNGLNKAKEYFGRGTPIINYMDVFSLSGISARNVTGLVDVSANERERFSAKRGDVFFTRTSETLEDIGVAAVLMDDLPDAVFSGFVLRGRPINDQLVDSFKKYCFGSEIVRQQITSKGTYTTRALTNGRILSSVLLPLPPTKAEQEAIADTLSDADACIHALERLVEKKRRLKKGAMSDLLSSQLRLPGYRGNWRDKSIQEIADCLDQLRVPLSSSQRLSMKGSYPYCGANGVLDYINTYAFDDDVILIAEDGGHFDEFDKRPIAYRMSGRFWVNNHAHVLKAREQYSQGFLFYSLVHKDIRPFLASGTRAKLNKSEMNKITVYMPEDRQEQVAISDVLSEMDAEIASLETRLEKARQIKQGMMQELLTGRVRLV